MIVSHLRRADSDRCASDGYGTPPMLSSSRLKVLRDCTSNRGERMDLDTSDRPISEVSVMSFLSSYSCGEFFLEKFLESKNICCARIFRRMDIYNNCNNRVEE